ncbi:hypothetical protein [Planktothrix phage Pra-JY27]|nr:hypothetical protein [Planktothrix phage Pag-Yong1]WEV89229.1 hypothetical protein [Synechococcus phage MinM2]
MAASDAMLRLRVAVDDAGGAFWAIMDVVIPLWNPLSLIAIVALAWRQ